MYLISKRFAFSASHRLDTLPPEHQCARLHGHNYTVTVWLSAAVLNEHGFVVDYGDLSRFKAVIDERYDHRHLNDVIASMTEDPPTAEVLAHLFYIHARRLDYPAVAVTVSETPTTTATYAPKLGSWILSLINEESPA